MEPKIVALIEVGSRILVIWELDKGGETVHQGECPCCSPPDVVLIEVMTSRLTCKTGYTQPLCTHQASSFKNDSNHIKCQILVK